MELPGDFTSRCGRLRLQASISAAVMLAASIACGSRPTLGSQDEADLLYAQRWQALEADAAGNEADVDGRTAIRLGHRYREVGDVALAEVWYRRSLTASHTPEATVALAALLMARGHYEAAEPVLKEVVDSKVAAGADREWAISSLGLIRRLRSRTPARSVGDDDAVAGSWINSLGMVFLSIDPSHDDTAGPNAGRSLKLTRRRRRTRCTVGGRSRAGEQASQCRPRAQCHCPCHRRADPVDGHDEAYRATVPLDAWRYG